MKKKHRTKFVRKICGCARRQWSSCEHPWHFNFKWKKGKASWRNDESMLARAADFCLPDGQRFGDEPIAAITEGDVETFLATPHPHIAAST